MIAFVVDMKFHDHLYFADFDRAVVELTRHGYEYSNGETLEDVKNGKTNGSSYFVKSGIKPSIGAVFSIVIAE